MLDLGSRIKKTNTYKEQDPKKVEEFEKQVKDIPKEKRCYVDESGFDTYYQREYGWAPEGEKVHDKILGRKFERRSIVAGKIGNEIIAPLEYRGTMHGELFEKWFEDNLLPVISEDTVIIMDNASFHRKKRLYEIAKRHNRRLIFLPPYSPELNPIEHFWNWLKKKIADVLKYVTTFEDAIYESLKLWILRC